MKAAVQLEEFSVHAIQLLKLFLVKADHLLHAGKAFHRLFFFRHVLRQLQKGREKRMKGREGRDKRMKG